LTGRISNKAPGTRELLARLRSVLLYLLSDDNDKADRIEALLAARGVISVQVLNEFSAVALRKLKMLLNDIREILDTIRAVCAVAPITLETHDRGLAVCEGYRFSLNPF
jgi:predicted nucleic acid-binding protein